MLTIVTLVAFWIAMIVVAVCMVYSSWIAKGKISKIIEIVVIFVLIIVLCTYMYVSVTGLMK